MSGADRRCPKRFRQGFESIKAMALEPINVLFGAVVALFARELVDARKAKRRLVGGQDVVLRAMKQELEEIRETVALNLLEQLWDREEAKWTHRNVHHWETQIDPLSPLPDRLDNLVRLDGPPELLGNSQMTGLLSYVVKLVTHIDLIDRQRMRFVSAQYRTRAVYLDREEMAERIERWEAKLLDMHVRLLRSAVQAAAIIGVIESDRMDSRRLRSRFGSIYEPDQFDWGALQQLIRENDSFELTSMTGSGAGGSNPRWDVLEDFGLAERLDHGWFVTARGRLAAGSGERFWRRPRNPDPPQKRVQFANFDPEDFL